jgi:8-oxo-dGTP diphosphatase
MNRIGGGGKVFPLSGCARSEGPVMRRRPSARLLILDPQDRLLLFRYVFRDGALAGDDYWGTPGGGLEAGETFEHAAIRELREETGITVPRVDPHIAQSEFVMRTPSGEDVISQERYFLVATTTTVLSRGEWTAEEANVIAEHKWWTRDEIANAQVQIWPDNILEMLARAGR